MKIEHSKESNMAMHQIHPMQSMLYIFNIDMQTISIDARQYHGNNQNVMHVVGNECVC